MAKFAFSNPTWTPTAVGHTAAMTANGACFVQGGSSTQRIRYHRVIVAGQAASTSSPMAFMLGRDSTVGVTSITLGTNGMSAPLQSATAALAAPIVFGFSATTMPQRSATLGGLLVFSVNGYGGAYQWLTKDDEIIDTVGNTASLGELSLSVFTGGTVSLVSSEIIVEAD